MSKTMVNSYVRRFRDTQPDPEFRVQKEEFHRGLFRIVMVIEDKSMQRIVNLYRYLPDRNDALALGIICESHNFPLKFPK